MDKKKMIKTAISMLKDVDPETIEVINFDRTEYDDGSVGFSVNLTTPPKKKMDAQRIAHLNASLQAVGNAVRQSTKSNSY